MPIGEKIRYWRLHKGMSQKELGDQIGMSQQQIGQYEVGTRIPKQETQIKIAKALGVHLRDLADASMWDEFDQQFGADKLAELSAEPSARDTVSKLSKKDQELLDILLKLDESARSALLGYAIRLAEEIRNKSTVQNGTMDIDSRLEMYQHGLLMGIATAKANYSIKPEDIDVDSIALTPELEKMVNDRLAEQRRILEEEMQQNKK